jgi:hypothetical protein
MPSRGHAQALIKQLEKAESAVDDLFLEATDDGIEALEAVLAACCESVLQRGPGGAGGAAGSRGPRQGNRRGRGRKQRGRRRPGASDGGPSDDASPAGQEAQS